MKHTTLLLIFFATASLSVHAAQSPLDTNRIEQITGLKGKMNDEEGVFKVSSPRTDVKVSVVTWHMPPFMGLTSWAAFMSGMHGDMVMDDSVLMVDDVN